MEINKQMNGNEMIVSPSGSLDTITTPDLEEKIGNLDGVTSLVIDCKGLDYVSSSGLRLFLKLHKAMKEKGNFRLINVSPLIKEIFDVTRFSDVLNIELA